MDLLPNLCFLVIYTFCCYTCQCTVQALIYKGTCTAHWSPLLSPSSIYSKGGGSKLYAITIFSIIIVIFLVETDAFHYQ